MKSVLATFVGIILISSVLLINQATAVPNENASDTAKVKIPEHAKEIAPGIFHIGFAVHEGKVVEGIMAFHHKPGHSGGPSGGNGGSEPTGDNHCYSLFAKGAKWKNIEPWVLNPQNGEGLTDNFLLANLHSDIQKWEDESFTNILGDGTLTDDILVADTASPDGVNEVYFGDIADPDSIAVTIVWGIFSGNPGKRVLVEWDQVYDDVTFGWSSTGNANKMDFENISTHEMGHSFGLSHPDNTCTEETMFAFADEGETKKQTLAIGDIAGINNLY